MDVFETVVIIRAIDAFTAPARRMAEQMGLVGAQAEALQQKLNGFRNMAFVGGAMTLVGGLMAKGLLSAVDAAGNLEMSLMGVKEALKLTNGEYSKAMIMAQNVGIPTIFSAEQVGGIMQAMQTAGLNKQQVLDQNIVKEYVNFADVQAQIKKENAPDVVSAAVRMAHQYQLYTPEQIDPFLNQLNAALLHTHDSADQFSTTFKYISNQARTQGVSASDSLATTAWLSRMGLGSGRGGTNFADFMRRSIYGSSGKKADEAMQTAGFVKDGHSVFEDAKGNFVGIPEAVKIMQDFNKRFGNNANITSPLLQAIFGTQGARVASLMTSQGASEQYTNIQKEIAGTEGIDKTQEDTNNTWQGKVKQLQTTLQDIKQAFGGSEKSVLYPFLVGLDDILGRILIFEQQHPELMKWIATFTSIAAAALLIVGPLLLITGVLGYLSTANMFSTGFKLLGTAIKGASAPMLVLIATGYLLYEAWKNDWGGIREKTKAVTDWIAQEIPKATKNVKDFAKDLGLIDDKGKLSDVVGWLAQITAGVYLGVKAYKALQLAAIAFNLASADNPWLLVLTGIILAVTAIVTHWDEVKQAIKDASAALREFLGITSSGKTKDQQTENAYKSFYNNPNYVPNNPNGTLQPAPHNPWANPLSGLQKWVRGYAAGTNYSSAGLAWVGEHGPELLNLPGGSQVIPNHKLGDLVPSKGDTHNHFASGSIVVHAAPGQSSDEIAEVVLQKLGRKMRNQSYSRPRNVVNAW